MDLHEIKVLKGVMDLLDQARNVIPGWSEKMDKKGWNKIGQAKGYILDARAEIEMLLDEQNYGGSDGLPLGHRGMKK